jgi:hypothetical protein
VQISGVVAPLQPDHSSQLFIMGSREIRVNGAPADYSLTCPDSIPVRATLSSRCLIGRVQISIGVEPADVFTLLL